MPRIARWISLCLVLAGGCLGADLESLLPARKGLASTRRRLTRRANHGHNAIIAKVSGLGSASAHANECAPKRGKTGANEHEKRIVAKRAAGLAHRDTERADRVMARGIETSCQNRGHGSS